jgi:predicted DNA-binding ribbon-helix-helix protein
MLQRYLEQRHIDLDSGRSCLALEREYWQALEVLAYEDGWNNWRDFFYMRVLPDKPEDISLASHVRKMVTVFLFNEFDEQRSICKSQLRSGHCTGKSKCNRLRSI